MPEQITQAEATAALDRLVERIAQRFAAEEVKNWYWHETAVLRRFIDRGPPVEYGAGELRAD